MLLIVLTCIALFQTAFTGIFTIPVYGIGLSIPLIVISSVGGALRKKIEEKATISREAFNRVISTPIIKIGISFLYFDLS